MTQPPVVLSIAGSDSGGGSGLQADLRTFAAHAVHGVCALTVVSAQNTESFVDAWAVPVNLLRSQIDTVTKDFTIDVTKTGLLYSEDNIMLVKEKAESGVFQHLVVDPVIVNRHGEPLYDKRLIRLIRKLLVPRSSVLTPNHLEAMKLLEIDADDEIDSMCDMALMLGALGAETVVVTGGRRRGLKMVDVVAANGEVTVLETQRHQTSNVRGSGDSFSAAIAAQIAKGTNVMEAISASQHFTSEAISRSANWTLGSGQGPIAHLGSLL